MRKMSSRERLLTAMRYGEPDHVPLVFNVFGFKPPARLAWSNQYEEAERWLSLDVDATLKVHLPLTFHPDVKVCSWEEHIPGERWPLMVKEYETPAGPIRQEVFRTEDWVSAEWPSHRQSAEVQLVDDYNVVRSRRFPVENEADVERIRYLLWPPTDEAIGTFRQQAAEVSRQAQRLGVLVESTVSMGTDMATWLCGVKGMVYMALDKPDLFEELLDIIHQRDKRVAEIVLDSPVDLVVRRGWYEGAAFWSPALFRRFFLPRIGELAKMAHQANRLMGYIMSTGFMPMLEHLVEAGYDVHYYIDPVQGGPGVDLKNVKQVFAGRIAVVGGVNSAVTLERGSCEEIRRAVFDAIATLGPGGGFILSPVDCISASTPWESIEVMIEAWREMRDYPIRLAGR
jgi:hypothetical protein